MDYPHSWSSAVFRLSGHDGIRDAFYHNDRAERRADDAVFGQYLRCTGPVIDECCINKSHGTFFIGVLQNGKKHQYRGDGD